jgi:hypothetical protein
MIDQSKTDDRIDVDVCAYFHRDGKPIRPGSNVIMYVEPYCVIWPTGADYDIERVLDMQRRASLKGGTTGIRYTVMIRGHERYLYRCEDSWFVERRE